MSTSKKKKKNLQWIIISIVTLFIILLIAGKKQGWFGETSMLKITTEKAIERDITESVNANGKIQPEKEVIIAPDASGEIVGLEIEEGQLVTKGQLLLKINPDIYLSSLDKVKASLNTTKANLANSKARLAQSNAQLIKAKSDFERSQKLFDQSVISKADYESAFSGYEVSKAEVSAAKQSVKASEFSVQNAEAALKEANDNLTKTAIYAPIDGTITKLGKEIGERVAGASQFSGGTEVMRIADLKRMEVQVNVNENDIVKIHRGDTALIEVDAYLDRKFKGIVSQIANSANVSGANTDQVTNFMVKIQILPASYIDLIDSLQPHLSPFRPGMSANVEILTKYEYNALSVPTGAITTRIDSIKKDDSSKTETVENEKDEIQEYVFVYSDGQVELRAVEIGIQNNFFTFIKSGITLEEEVVTAPYRAVSKKLKDGEKVERVDKKKLYSKED